MLIENQIIFAKEFFVAVKHLFVRDSNAALENRSSQVFSQNSRHDFIL